jgi:hypothetical protein
LVISLMLTNGEIATGGTACALPLLGAEADGG